VGLENALVVLTLYSRPLFAAVDDVIGEVSSEAALSGDSVCTGKV
jgi:hypothetical protein